MKKLFAIILSVCLLLASCGDSVNELSVSNNTDGLKAHYKNAEAINDWRVIAALYLEGENADKYNISLKSNGSIVQDASCAISCAVLSDLWGINGYEKTDYTASLLKAVDAPYTVPTRDLCMAMLALYACGIRPAAVTPALEHLKEIQLSGGGWGVDSKSAYADGYTSALVLSVITAYREDYKNNDSRDDLINYINSLNCIANDYTVADETEKASSKATMSVLTSLIFSGIPADGETSMYLCDAMKDFKSESVYSMYKGGTYDEDATAEVFYAFATTRRASIFYFFSEEYKEIVKQ